MDRTHPRQPFFRPSEERLFDWGWKENCYFYGNADSFVTAARTPRERRTSLMSMFNDRGMVYPLDDNDDKTIDDPDDQSISEVVDTGVDEEDQFLPPRDTPLVSSLPSLLRSSLGSRASLPSLWSDMRCKHIKRYKRHRQFELRSMLSYIFHLVGPRLPCSVELLDLQEDLPSSVCTEFLPALRCIAALERNCEIMVASTGLQQSAMRRTTRNLSQGNRPHYFDSFSLQLKNSGFDLSSSEVGIAFASSMLRYANERS